MAITATVLTEAASTAASPYTTVSISPTAGRVLLVLTQLGGIATATATTVAGLSGTWTNVGGSNRYISRDLSAHWCTDYTGTGTLTIDNADGGLHGIWCVLEIDGADLTTPVVAGSFQFASSGFVSTASITLNAAAGAGSRPFVAWGCDNNTAGQGTPRVNWTELSDRGIGAPTGVLETQWRSDAFETTASIDWVGGPYTTGGIALEIAAAGAGQTIAVNQVTSTETAHPVAHRKTRTVGQPTESDTALRLAKRAPVAQHAEADTAQPVAAITTRTVGQPVESDTAQPIGSAKTKAVGQLVEADTAQPAARIKSAALGQATESDTAQKLATGALGVADEQDTANPVRAVKTRAVGQALTAETSQLITHGKRRAVAQIVSLDTATGIARLKSRAVGEATSTETVTGLASLKARAVAQATETDTARFVTGPADGDDGGFRLPLLTTAIPDLTTVTDLDLTTRTDLETLGVTTAIPDLAITSAVDIPALVTALPNLATATTLPALDTTTALEGKVNDLFSDVFEEVY